MSCVLDGKRVKCSHSCQETRNADGTSGRLGSILLLYSAPASRQ